MLNNLIKTSDGRYFPTGEYEYMKTNAGCSKIYLNRDILKIYYNFIPEYLRITEDIFEILKDIDKDSFVKLKEFYKEDKIIAYTSEYIDHEDDFNILDKNIEFVKYNMRRMEQLILLFTKLKIAIRDVNYRNYLCWKDNLILIDPDQYRFTNIDCLLEYNYKQLINSFRDLYTKSFYKVTIDYEIGSDEFNRIMGYVFKYDSIDRDNVRSICNRLEEVNIKRFKKNY